MSQCDAIIHGPPGDPFEERCTRPATHRLSSDELDREALLCARHAKILRNMYEPGEIKKLRVPVKRSKE